MNANAPIDLESHLGYLMRRASNRVSDSFAKRLAEHGVSVSEWVCLVQIHNEPRIMPSKLAANAGMTQGAISKICDKLIAKGWIAAKENEEDLRGRFLTLTEAGAEFVPSLVVIADANERVFFGALQPEERVSLRQILSRLSQIHNWDEIPLQ